MINHLLLNDEAMFLYISSVEVLKTLGIIKETYNDFYYQIKKVENKNTLNTMALKKYKDMYGILPNKTSFFKVLSFIINEESIPVFE